jgi:UDP:flavonoid glycosyltransferase YjiC (YdhE family)
LTTVLLGWELGANLGHARPLAEIGRYLVAGGYRVVAAVRDLHYARVAFRDLDIGLLQAPVWPPHRHFGSETGAAGYLDILVNIGFAQPAKLEPVVDAWLGLLALVKPQAIIADHSPALLLAARIAGIPVVLVGTGFTAPPANYDRLPPIRADRAPIMPEQRVLASVAELCTRHGKPAPDSLIELFRPAARIVFGCRELDPYAPLRIEPMHLPPEALPAFTEPPVAPRLFAYLGIEVPNLERLVQVLVELDIPLSVYLRGELGALARFLELRGHEVHAAPPPLSEVLPAVSHVIAGAGAFTCHAVLAAGRPLLALPQHGEADLNVIALDRLGVVRRLDPYAPDAVLREEIKGFVRNHTLLRHARNWAQLLATREQPDGNEAVLRAIREIAPSAQPARVVS